MSKQSLIQYFLAAVRDKKNSSSFTHLQKSTGKSIDFERHMMAPEIWLVLNIGFDPGGYFLCGLNLF